METFGLKYEEKDFSKVMCWNYCNKYKVDAQIQTEKENNSKSIG